MIRRLLARLRRRPQPAPDPIAETRAAYRSNVRRYNAIKAECAELEAQLAAESPTPARQWVRVEFLAAPPEGKPLNRIDPRQAAVGLAETFGVEVITSLVVSAAEGPARPPRDPLYSEATMHAVVAFDGRLIEHPGPWATCLSDHCNPAKDFVL